MTEAQATFLRATPATGDQQLPSPGQGRWQN